MVDVPGTGSDRHVSGVNGHEDVKSDRADQNKKRHKELNGKKCPMFFRSFVVFVDDEYVVEEVCQIDTDREGQETGVHLPNMANGASKLKPHNQAREQPAGALG